jgi:hypothetical protein
MRPTTIVSCLLLGSVSIAGRNNFESSCRVASETSLPQDSERRSEAEGSSDHKAQLDAVIRSLETPAGYDVSQTTFQVKAECETGAWIDSIVFGDPNEVPRLAVLRQRLNDLASDPGASEQGVVGNAESPARFRIQVGGARILQQQLDADMKVVRTALQTPAFTLVLTEATATLEVLPRSARFVVYDPAYLVSPLPFGELHRDALARANWSMSPLDSPSYSSPACLVKAVLEEASKDRPWREIVLAGEPPVLPVYCRALDTTRSNKSGFSSLYEWKSERETVQLATTVRITGGNGLWLVTLFERSNIASRESDALPTLSAPQAYRIIDQTGATDQVYETLEDVPTPLRSSLAEVINARG